MFGFKIDIQKSILIFFTSFKLAFDYWIGPKVKLLLECMLERALEDNINKLKYSRAIC
jgi:hypothetical protein